MFFSPDLLSRRDSGFSLLWLAATLGSKSSFKKLPKRSILTADITQLCDLIAEPAEPLALRLSSNLMVGVARVYKVKQEIFMSDVTTCFNSLKKMVQELQSLPASDARLQMAQGSVRPSALTLTADPRTAFAMNFDDLVADWDEYLNIGEAEKTTADDPDDNFDPKAKQTKQRHKPHSLPLSENLRADLYTLKEHHDHLLSNSFDVSFLGSGIMDPSSSQLEGGFALDDFFDAGDGLDVGGGIGDELAKELGEGWGGSPMKDANEYMDIDLPPEVGFNNVDIAMDFDFDLGGDMALVDDVNGGMYSDPGVSPNARQKSAQSKKQRHCNSDKENLPPSSSLDSNVTPRSMLTATGFAELFLSQEEPPSNGDIVTIDIQEKVKKPKRTRLVFDARIELTDEELKTARMQYREGQDVLRREIVQKKSEKDIGKMVENMLWGVPSGIQAQELVDFWQENFRVQVEARSGAQGQPPAKRRKIRKIRAHEEINGDPPQPDFWDAGFDIGINANIDVGMEDDNTQRDIGRLHSSEEPGQGRRVSRPPSAFGSYSGFDLGIQDPPVGSQRSSLFPWDNAAASSSVLGGGMVGLSSQGGDGVGIDSEIRGNHKSLSRQGSTRMGSILSGGGFSPAPVGYDSRLSGEDFIFDVPVHNSPVLESQQSGINLITLERNSYNFLEYAKMQYQILPNLASLVFDDIVPRATSTRHVAAAAFYHCLVLATKDLIHVNQECPYGALSIMIV